MRYLWSNLGVGRCSEFCLSFRWAPKSTTAFTLDLERAFIWCISICFFWNGLLKRFETEVWIYFVGTFSAGECGLLHGLPTTRTNEFLALDRIDKVEEIPWDRINRQFSICGSIWESSWFSLIAVSRPLRLDFCVPRIYVYVNPSHPSQT
jgi:hypothetical protein